MMDIQSIDHLVLTVKDIDTSCNFYSKVMNMDVVEFGDGRKALKFGDQKINLHQKGNKFEPKAHNPACGSADLCFISTTNINEIIKELTVKNIKIIRGPVERVGAKGKILSIYFRDPDLNLIEVSNYIK
jgi:catechol 2,3-dioxygenase-like lactoylglutathione lyase family enzyme